MSAAGSGFAPDAYVVRYSRYRCIGVRSLGTRQTHRPGNGSAASPLGQRAEQYCIDAGRPDVIPGADGA